jgi:putative serine protease PepD
MSGERQEPSGSRPRWWLWGLIGGVVVAGVGGGLIGAAVASPSSPSTASSTATPANAVASCEVTPVADKVLPSVVTISAKPASGDGTATGSGEVIKSDGYILTNNHVIAGAVDGGTVEVLFADGTSAPASLVGRDVLTDLAVLKATLPSGVPAIQIGSSQSLQVGEPVVALGAPLGLSGTVTSGIVSALDRTVEVPAEGDTSALLVAAVQTDAAINPGNSGGALVNCGGQLVGVPSAGATVPNPEGESSGGSIGLGFAIPVDSAITVADEIIATGRATHSYFGLQTVPIPEAAAAEAGVTGGLFVGGVVPGGPAEKAGLQEGDVITTIDGKPATSNIQLQEVTLTKNPGDKVELGYLRGGKSETATVTLGAQP